MSEQSAIILGSKDETLTKAHVRYLESRVQAQALGIGRCILEQNQAGGAKLPESDREDMEVFLSRIRQLLPVLGTDILTPIAQPSSKSDSPGHLYCQMKGDNAEGERTSNGFVVLNGSTAVLEPVSSAEKYPYLLVKRNQLITDGEFQEKNGFLVFTEDVKFSSPYAPAVVINGRSAKSLTSWKNKEEKDKKSNSYIGAS